MDSLFAMLFLASLILLIVGLFKPKTSLFWDKSERTKKKSGLVYGGLTVLFFVLFGITDTSNQSTENNSNSKTETKDLSIEQTTVITPSNPIEDSIRQVQEALEQKRIDGSRKAEEAVAEKEREEEERILQKLKNIARRDWPNDYSTQEFWINEQIEDYRYMKTIPNNSIKRQAQRDWPFDFSTQKFWYNEQMEAKERLGY